MSENENRESIAKPSTEGTAATPKSEPTQPDGGASAASPQAAAPEPSEAPAPAGDAPQTAEPKTDASTSGEAEAKADAPEADAKSAEAKADAPKTAEPKADATSGEAEAKADAPKTAEPKADAKSGEATEAEAKGDGKKKRKRRRKKKKEGDKKGDQAFARFFEGSGPRQHAFRVGEVVAGRVTRVEDGAIVVDLFGKALAIADVLEPREVEEPPEPPADVNVAPTSAAAEAKAPAGDTAAEATPDTKNDATPEAAEPAKVEPAQATPEAAEPAKVEPAQATPEAAEPAKATPEAAQPAQADAEATPEAAEPSTAEAAEPAEAKAGGDAKPADAGDAKADAAPAPKAEKPAIEPIPLEPEPPHPEPPQVGSIFRGRVGSVAESGHIAIVNRHIERPRAKAAIKLAHEERRRVPGVVYGYNRGGFDVLVAGIRCFAPAGGMTLDRIDDPEALIGRKLEFSVPKSKGKSIVVTRRSLLEKEARQAAKARLDELKVGQKLAGKVTDVRDYGALVDIDGIEGLVHMSEIAWTRGGKPSDHVKVGDEVQVEVLKIQKVKRKDRYGKVSLSIRKCLPDPWEEHAEVLQVGKPRKGKVVSLTDFGAFLELVPGIEGLLHISELEGKPAHAKDVLSEGDELDVVIDRKDDKQRRLSLSLLTSADLEAIEKGELDLSQAPRSTKKGDYVTVVVDRIERHGLLVQVKGLIGKRGRGYVPMRELPEEGETKKRFSQGSEHEMKIIGTDRDGRLRLSVKGKLRDEEQKAVREYRKEAATKGFGTFGDLLKAKLEK